MNTIERRYAQFGMTRRPQRFGGEGFFAFRWRAEYTLGVAFRDENPLRERLYREWRRRRFDRIRAEVRASGLAVTVPV